LSTLSRSAAATSSNSSACGECVAKTFDEVQNATPPRQQCYKAAYLYVDYCAVVYSSEDILAPNNTTGDDGTATMVRWDANSWGSSSSDIWSISNITGDGDDVSLTVGRLHDLLVGTVKAATTATPRLFATGVMDKPKVFYSLAQCTPDLSAGNCLACLNNLLGMVNSSTALRNGGRISFIRCSFRYQEDPFYDSQPIVRLLGLPSAPAPTPATTVVKHESKFPWL
jgi:hypothetical protein